MKGKAFLDTNILVYCYSADDPIKQRTAVEVASNPNSIISSQVIQELCNTLYKKFKLDWEKIGNVVAEVEDNLSVFTNTLNTIRIACKIANSQKFSFYDSLIVAAALESGCEILYSEDLHHGQVIENQILITNPFL